MHGRMKIALRKRYDAVGDLREIAHDSGFLVPWSGGGRRMGMTPELRLRFTAERLFGERSPDLWKIITGRRELTAQIGTTALLVG